MPVVVFKMKFSPSTLEGLRGPWGSRGKDSKTLYGKTGLFYLDIRSSTTYAFLGKEPALKE